MFIATRKLILAPLFAVAISFTSALPSLSEPTEPPVQLDAEQMSAAQKAAASWLAVVDAGNYALSRHLAAAIFQQRVTLEQVENSIQRFRTQLGQLNSRKLDSISYTKTLPDAPDGEYVILQYNSAFEQQKSARETIVLTKEKDGQWRVGGYFIAKGLNS